MDQREHVLARPDMYIGSVHRVEDKQWVYAGEGSRCCEKKKKPKTD
jgi:DNA gyrase/topoisomerase IV subunit B